MTAKQKRKSIRLPGYYCIVGVPLVGTRKNVGKSPKRADTRPAPTTGLGDIIGAYKSITTHKYIRNNPARWETDKDNPFV